MQTADDKQKPTVFDDSFVFKNWHFSPESGELLLHYATTKYGDFTEQYHFPTVSVTRYLKFKTQLDAAIDCLHWMAGVSYYKTSLAEHISFAHSSPTAKQADWLNQTWQAGLAELAVSNGLAWLDHIKFQGVDSTVMPDNVALSPRSLVAIGGGKDSLVTIEAIKAMPEEASLFMVGQSPFIQAVAEHTHMPLLQVKRKVDAKLQQVNQQGAYNGHVPITAINCCVAVVAALLYDYDSVVFSNERSADSGNFKLDNGQWVNHQYSKSLAYEQTWQSVVDQHIVKGLDCFSLLRPYSELAIVKKFADLTQYFPYFSSCNRNFHLTGTQNRHHHWCGQCPKCAFVFLCLAPFISKDQLLKIFKKDLLADEHLVVLFESLLGIQGNKPFECVGEVHECRLALQLLAVQADWLQHPQLQQWAQLLPAMSEEMVAQIMAASEDHLIPAKRRFLQVLDDVA